MRPGPDAWTTNPETGKRELTQEYKDQERRWREGQMFPRRSEVVTKPTRDLNRGREWAIEGGIRRDPRDRVEVMGGGPEYWKRKRQEERRDKRRGGRRGGWWNEPRRPEPRREYPTEFSDRLSSDAERMRLLTGEADPIKSPDSSRLLRDDYDPVDREFNRQFDEAPRGRQPWHSDPTGNPLERDPLADYDFREGRSTSPQRSPEQIRRIEEKKEEKFQPRKPKRNIKNRGEEKARIQPMPSPPSIPEPPKEPKYGRWQDAELPDDRVYAGGPSPIEGISGHDYVNQPKTYDDRDLKKRIAALEERGPIINQPTQDLSGITGRLSELEGRKPDTSWKDPLAAVQAGQTQGQEARSALDTRLTALEKYYKNDPPPKQSLGSRYEDKAAEYARQWEVKNPTYDPDRLISKDRPNEGWGEWTYGKRGEAAWAGDLPTIYKRNMRALNREYNKPTYEATIKGRDYKAYGYDDKTRLKMLDQQNIHEDEYLGSGTWTNKWGEQIKGLGRGEQDRYFTSHSGLDPQSQEYKDRFRKDQKYTYSRPGGDYSWRGDDRGYEYRSHKDETTYQDSPFENEFLDSGGRIVKTKGGQDYLWPDSPYS